MKTLLKRLLTALVGAAMLQCAILPTGALSIETASSTTAKVVTPEGATMEYTATDYVINSDAERALLSGGSGHTMQFGTTYYRIADGNRTFTYCLDGEMGQMAYIVMDLAYEFVVSVSDDNKEWVEVFNFNNEGSFREKRAIDLTPYFEFSNKVYVKIADAVPDTGWGGQVRSLRYVTISGPDGELPAYQDISEEWKASTGATVDAGESVAASAGSEVTFQKTVRVPSNWIGGELGLSFSWVESGSTPIVRVDGQEIASVTYYGNNLTIPLPEGTNGKSIDVEVVTTATEEDISGLWNSVRIGYLDMVTMPESTWSLDDEVRKIQENYFTDGTDLVKLNALAGNYNATLYDGRYGLVSFNGMMRDAQLFYAHDTSRNLAAYALEELYSPIVRLDTIEDLYQGIKAAMVPDGEYEMFLKVDARPKQVRSSSVNAKMLRMETNQDLVEAFADVYVTTTAGDKSYPLAKQTVSDANKEDGMIRTYTSDSVSAVVDVTWPSCMTDKPTTLAFSSETADTYTVVFTNFQKLGREASNFSVISTQESGILATVADGVTELAVPEEGYITLSKGEGWYAFPTILTWDIKPQKIVIKSNSDSTAYTEIQFVYSGSDTPTMSAVPFESIDPDLGWAYRVAQHIVSEGVYGANGYDPTYICGTEGLGPGALAAAAYIFKKYDHPLAAEAEKLAYDVNWAAFQASITRNHTPSYFLDRMQGCLFLNLMGYNEFIMAADYYAGKTLDGQSSDGTFYYFDGRNVLTLQLMYEILDLSEYKNGIEKYRSSVTYTDEYVLYKGEQLTPHLHLLGASDLGYLGHMGDTEALNSLMTLIADSLNDTGVFDCSDINPYFLGWSLKGVMNVQYDVTDKKTIVKKGQSVLYDADGNVEILDYPTAYMNNPYLYSDYVLERPVTLGDVNADSSINASDALLALQHSVKLITLEDNKFEAADVNQDDVVDASDALKILQHSVGLIEEF